MKKHNIVTYLLAVTLLVSCHLQAYQVRSFNIEELQVDACRKVPRDISFIIADMKFDGNNLKVLELGEGPRSYFRGHEKLFGQGKIWERFWHYLSQFKVPVWYVGKQPDTDYKLRQMCDKSFKNLGGDFAANTYKLKQDTLFKALCGMEVPDDCRIGMVLLRHHKMPKIVVKRFKENYQRFLVIDSATNPFVNNKYKTAQVFDQAGLSNYKPQWKTYAKKYSPELTEKIINDFPQTDTYVLKPLNAANGWGVLIVNKAELNETLKTIFGNTNDLLNFTDKSYSYWYQDKNTDFLVEEYVPSRTVTVKGKRYDATMRVVMALDYQEDDVINMTFLGGYWKLPCLALDEEGSLTERHKSKIANGRPCSLAINKEDFKTVKAILQDIVPKLYSTMVAKELGVAPAASTVATEPAAANA